jgi:hypothetical protein
MRLPRTQEHDDGGSMVFIPHACPTRGTFRELFIFMS